MDDVCRICLETKDKLDTNVLDYVDTIENLVGVEFDRNPDLPQKICDNCRQKLSNVKETCALCANSYEFFLNYVPKEIKKESAESEHEDVDTEYVNIEVLDEAMEEREDSIEIKNEFFPDEDSIKAKDTDTGQEVQASNMKKLVKIVKKQLKRKTDNRHVIFCKTPKKKGSDKKHTVTGTGSKTKRKASLPLTYNFCCQCTEIVFSSEEAERHFVQSHPDCKQSESKGTPTDHSCNFCRSHFETAQELINHRSTVDRKTNSTSFDFTCPLCNQSGFTLTDYKVHGEKEHGSEATYSCQLCPISYTNFSSFTSHMYVKHKNEQNNVCVECGKSYARKNYLDSHYRVEHQGRRDFQCKLCGVTFKRSCNLNSHMRVHTGEKPYKCSDCPKAYSHYIDLKTHVANRHTGIFKYNCTACGKGFVKPSQMKIHMTKHADNKI